MAKKQSLEKKNALRAQSARRKEERAQAEQAILNRCLGLLAILTVAEIYFLMCYRFYARGTFHSLVAMGTVIQVVSWVGLGLLAAGIVLAVMRREKRYFHGCIWLAVFGLVLFAGGRLMLVVYPAGTVACCVAVPLLALAGFVYYLYQHEFFCVGLGLGAAIFGMWFAHRAVGSGWSGRVTAVEILLLVIVAALLAFTVVVGRNGGVLGKGEKARKVFSDTTNYTVAYGVLALAAVALILVAAASSAALYLMWAGVALLFALAVYYTLHLM